MNPVELGNRSDEFALVKRFYPGSCITIYEKVMRGYYPDRFKYIYFPWETELSKKMYIFYYFDSLSAERKDQRYSIIFSNEPYFRLIHDKMEMKVCFDENRQDLVFFSRRIEVTRETFESLLYAGFFAPEVYDGTRKYNAFVGAMQKELRLKK